MKLRESAEKFGQRVGLSTYTVRKMCHNNKLIARKVGRSWQIDVEASENGLSLISGNTPEKAITKRRITDGKK
ncbi:hypothetical protein TSACC_21671 [Terrimicrobium sacchariphilum]|uniref:Helix-turn-helix domain-containing protein n=1 Tax=Terrimicrobium sacchariphilum TaxID=690879 RepID=A0A146G9B6_TERSA|nr:hypothetical protein [Terrimicrobium sacchariphilum]GAT33258.1 hypothetical protein TSACC_21671 [Terrimicrobium sacchariphilum]